MLTLSRSRPPCLKLRVSAMASCRVSSSRPSNSITPKRAVSGSCSGQTARTACSVSSRKRAVVGSAAVVILALIGVYREEALRQIAVGKMQLQPLEAGIACALCGGDEIAAHAGDVVQRHLTRHFGQAAAEGDGRGRDGVPATRVAVGDVVVAFPRQVGTGLAAGVADLDARHGAGSADRCRDARQSLGLGVVPQAQAPGVMRPSGDTPVASTMTRPAPPRAMLA